MPQRQPSPVLLVVAANDPVEEVSLLTLVDEATDMLNDAINSVHDEDDEGWPLDKLFDVLDLLERMKHSLEQAKRQ